MPIKRPPLVNNEIYHIVIRAIEGLKLFRNERDCIRMLHDLFEFNNEISTSWEYRQHYEKCSRSIKEERGNKEERELLVEISAFCLMSNHVHLLVRQLKDGGISKFMRKIGAGYGGYYNKKYQRRGRLFDGRYKVVHIKTDNQLKIVFVYIHTNPVAILVPDWKEGGISSKELPKIIKFLEDYRWSSYSDYLEKKNSPSLTSREFLINEMGGIGEIRRFVSDWLQSKRELKEREAHIFLES